MGWTGEDRPDLSNRNIRQNLKPLYVLSSKNYQPRFVFLPDEGMAFFFNLAKNKASHEHLFTTSKGRGWLNHYAYPFKAAVRAAGLPDDFCFHGLRHTYASQLVQAGAPLLVVSEQLGHKGTFHVSQTYGHLAPQMREAEVRQRFTVLSPQNAKKAASQKKALTQWRKSLQGSDWRTYAAIADLSGRRRYERVHAGLGDCSRDPKAPQKVSHWVSEPRFRPEVHEKGKNRGKTAYSLG